VEHLGGEESWTLAGCPWSPSTHLPSWALERPCHVCLNHSSSCRWGTKVSRPHGASYASHPSQASQAAGLDSLLPWLLRVWRGETELGWGRWFSLPPSLTSLEWFSLRCHGNGACSRRRGIVRGTQPLPGVGRRQPVFHPVQVPTAGRDGGFKMGGEGDREMALSCSSEIVAGNQFEPPFCH